MGEHLLPTQFLQALEKGRSYIIHWASKPLNKTTVQVKSSPKSQNFRFPPLFNKN